MSIFIDYFFYSNSHRWRDHRYVIFSIKGLWDDSFVANRIEKNRRKTKYKQTFNNRHIRLQTTFLKEFFDVNHFFKRASLVIKTLEMQIWSLWQEDPLEEGWQPTPGFLSGEFHGQKSLAGHSPWGPKESDTAEAT